MHHDDILNKLYELPDAAHLQRLAQTAVQLYPDDANTVLIKLRQFGEAALRYLTERWQIDTADLDKQHDLLMLLQYKLILPPDIIAHFHALRKTGNRAVHEWHDDLADARANLQHARHIAEWLRQTFAPAPPAAEHAGLPADEAPPAAEKAVPEGALPAEDTAPAADETPPPAKPRKPKKTAAAQPSAAERAAQKAERQAEKARLRAEAQAERRAQREAEKREKQARQEESVRQYREQKNRRAAHEQAATAQFDQGMAHEARGEFSQAFAHYREAAERGYVPAMTKLGLLYTAGRGTEADPEAAGFWNHLAADHGDPIACNNLGILYARGQGVPQNAARALELYHRAARKNYAPAQYNLGHIYRKGQLVPQNYTLAASWYKKAVARKLYAAHYWLGFFYENGHGVRQNPAKAEQHYRLGAESGDKDAQLALADFLLRQTDGGQDYAQAARWLHQAAQQGLARAQHNLAMILGMGLGGVPVDLAAAEYWLKQAAKQNYPESLAFIKERFPDGL